MLLRVQGTIAFVTYLDLLLGTQLLYIGKKDCHVYAYIQLRELRRFYCGLFPKPQQRRFPWNLCVYTWLGLIQSRLASRSYFRFQFLVL